jgi:hydroxymethylpyrimidine pyrophosphatase-like HAD family hydrolase
VHLHLTASPDDKASGVLRFLYQRFGDDPSSARARYAFVGDSGNDAACFAAFATTVGVANVVPHLPRLSVPPRYVTRAERGAGFAEALDAFVALAAAG